MSEKLESGSANLRPAIGCQAIHARGPSKIADAARKMFLKKFSKLLIFENFTNLKVYIFEKTVSVQFHTRNTPPLFPIAPKQGGGVSSVGTCSAFGKTRGIPLVKHCSAAFGGRVTTEETPLFPIAPKQGGGFLLKAGVSSVELY